MKKPYIKKVYVFLSSAIIFLLHLPFVFARVKPAVDLKMKPRPVSVETSYTGDSTVNTLKTTIGNSISSLYEALRLNLMGLSQQAFEYAMKGFNYLVETGKVANARIISIVDFSQPSSKKRLFIIDLDNNKVVFNTYVAHGVNSGGASATRFSNVPESNESSLGFYETQNTYMGNNGYSLKLEGLESGINDNANRRAIVIHGAAYVNESLVQSQGYIGRSWGCPAVPEKLNKPIIDKIKNGTCLFIYSPDKNYLNRSGILHPAGS